MIACNAGGTALTESGETLGMVRALLSAGAHSAVLPAWKVFAPSAALWSREFYRHLETQPAAEAARLALLAVKNDLRFRSPEHWAPYLYFGR
jgi:CHAT domain-containing protein